MVFPTVHSVVVGASLGLRPTAALSTPPILLLQRVVSNWDRMLVGNRKACIEDCRNLAAKVPRVLILMKCST